MEELKLDKEIICGIAFDDANSLTIESTIELFEKTASKLFGEKANLIFLDEGNKISEEEFIKLCNNTTHVVTQIDASITPEEVMVAYIHQQGNIELYEHLSEGIPSEHLMMGVYMGDGVYLQSDGEYTCDE
jgi:hypothetical protein